MIMSVAILDDVPTFERNVTDVCIQNQRVSELYKDVRYHYTDTFTSSKKETLYNKIAAIFEKSHDISASKNDVVSVSPATFNNAIKLILALPLDVPNPEIDIDSDGEISFEWYLDKTRLLFISVSPEGRLSYAGRFASNSKANGEEWIKDDQIPREITHYISKLK